MKIKTLIADSDPKTRKTLRTLISGFVEDIDIVGEAENSKQIQGLIKNKSPQLIFIEQDICQDENKRINKLLNKEEVEIILVRGQNGWVESEDCSCHGILTKPIALEDLTDVIDKYKERQRQKTQEQMDAFFVPFREFNKRQETKIGIPVVGAWRITKMNNVLYCTTSGRNTEIHLVDGSSFVAIRPLKYFEELIELYGFCRIRESHLVNLNQIVQYNKGRGGSVILSNEEEITVSRNSKDTLIRKLTETTNEDY